MWEFTMCSGKNIRVDHEKDLVRAKRIAMLLTKDVVKSYRWVTESSLNRAARHQRNR